MTDAEMRQLRDGLARLDADLREAVTRIESAIGNETYLRRHTDIAVRALQDWRNAMPRPSELEQTARTARKTELTLARQLGIGAAGGIVVALVDSLARLAS